MQRLVAFVSALVLVILVQQWTHGRRRTGSSTVMTPVSLPAATPRGAHPRLLLDAPAIARLKEAAKKRTPAWETVHEKCDQNVSGQERSGYQGFDWAYAMQELALCWYATGDKAYAKTAVLYFSSLLYDLESVGDRKGGDKKIESDSGYPMRTHGVYLALGFDWLHDSPGMTPQLRADALGRLKTWLGWYYAKGYHRDAPGTNYFLGYLTAQMMAGLGTWGETPAAAEWLSDGRDRMMGKMLLPFLATSFAGGDYPEGWQYGELYAAEIAMIAEAYRTATGVPLAKDIPWLSEVIKHHNHALQPGGLAVYDGGDWSDRPCKPSRVGLSMIANALEPVSPDRAAEARYVLKQMMPESDQVRWMSLLAERPGGREIDLRSGKQASLHIPSTGLSLMRSGWDAQAVFASMVAGPHLVEDHQHHDQGHFELWRGNEALLVDGADYGSYGTINHNSLLVWDGGKVLNYSPNQGDWGSTPLRTLRFTDDSDSVLVVGDLADAYVPACAPREGCTKRAVDSAIRIMVYVRPQTLWIEDRIKLRDFVDGASWLGHTQVKPIVDKRRVQAVNGGSRLEMEALLPENLSFTSVRQPTVADKGYAQQDNPWGDSIYRLELRTHGGGEHRFMVVAQALGAKDPARPVTAIKGTHLDGGATGGVAVLFSDGGEGSAEVPRGTRVARVAGLDAKQEWTLSATGCQVSLRKTGRPASNGMLKVSTDGCR